MTMANAIISAIIATSICVFVERKLSFINKANIKEDEEKRRRNKQIKKYIYKGGGGETAGVGGGTHTQKSEIPPLNPARLPLSLSLPL